MNRKLHNNLREEARLRRKRFFSRMLIFGACMALTTSVSLGLSFQDWLKKIGRFKNRRSSAKQTMVAAVRGIDEPSQVDPNARDFEGVYRMEIKKFSDEAISKFMAEGKLKRSAVKDKEVLP